MAIVRIPEEHRTLEDAPAIAAFLAQHGIDYERWTDTPGHRGQRAAGGGPRRLRRQD